MEKVNLLRQTKTIPMRKIKNYLFIISMIISGQFFAQEGPGGVETTSLNLWLRADKNYDVDLINNISTWNDQVFGLQATANGTEQPTFITADSDYNNRSTIEFDGTNDVMDIPNHWSFSTDKMTLFIVGEYSGSSAWEPLISKSAVPASDGWAMTRNNQQSKIDFWVSGSANNAQVNVTTNKPSILGGRYDQVAVTLQLNGGSPGIHPEINPINHVTSDLLIGQLGSDYLDGKIAEVIKYGKALNRAELVIVQNYLSSRYAIPLSSNDYYSYESTHGEGVIGIGQHSSTELHSSSKGCGILRVNNPSDLSDGDYMFIGHNNASTGAQIITSPPIFTGTANRMQRSWRVDKAGDVGKVSLEFDLTGTGFNYIEDEYELLIDPDGDFTGDNYVRHIIGRKLDNNTDILSFNAVDLSAGDYFTLVAWSPYKISGCPASNYQLYNSCIDENYTINYRDPIPNVTFMIHPNKIYSSAPKFGRTKLETNHFIDLKMDIYEPCIIAADRPIILICGGGGYTNNSKSSKRVQYRAKQYVKRGYVVAAFTYRGYKNTQVYTNSDCSSINPCPPGPCSAHCPDNSPTCEAFGQYLLSESQSVAEDAWQEMVYKTTQDVRAAIRYIKHNASTYDADPSKVFITGNSAGGGLTLQSIYYDNEDIIPSGLETDFGHLDEFADNAIPGSVNHFVNGGLALWGFLSDLDYMQDNESNHFPPIALFHGTWDRSVHFQENNFWGGTSYGSEAVAYRANTYGHSYKLWSICEGKHGPWAFSNCEDDPDVVDFNQTLELKSVQFFYDILNNQLASIDIENNSVHDFKNPLDLQGVVADVCPALDGGNSQCPDVIADLHTYRIKAPQTASIDQDLANIEVYPNPSNGSYKVTNMPLNTSLFVYNIQGQLVYSSFTQESTIDLNLNDQQDGVYVLKIESKLKQETRRIVKMTD